MAGCSDLRSFVQRFILLTFLAVLQVTGEEICDPSKCPGPLRYYKEIGCKPVYNQFGDCCPKRFDCDQVKNLSRDKCFVNGHWYSIGEKLRREDLNVCDIECTCNLSWSNDPEIECTVTECPERPTESNCFIRDSPSTCCGSKVCLKEGEIIATCEVDGTTYSDGQYFSPKSDPDLDCFCQPGYKGENVEPFCKKPNRNYCSPLFRSASDIHQKCAPVFYDGQNPQKDCSVTSRCQNSNDTVIHNHDIGKSLSDEEENNVCLFGDMKMHVGDELNQGTDCDSVCVKCVCEVPPVPTCLRLPESKCNLPGLPCSEVLIDLNSDLYSINSSDTITRNRRHIEDGIFVCRIALQQACSLHPSLCPSLRHHAIKNSITPAAFMLLCISLNYFGI